MQQLAANIQIAPSGGFQGLGTLAKPTGTGITDLQKFLSSAIGIMTIIAIIWFIFIFITGAFTIMNAGGDKQALETGRKKITNGIIGIVVVIVSVFVIDLLGTLLGIPFLDIFQLFYRIIGQP